MIAHHSHSCLTSIFITRRIACSSCLGNCGPLWVELRDDGLAATVAQKPQRTLRLTAFGRSGHDPMSAILATLRVAGLRILPILPILRLRAPAPDLGLELQDISLFRGKVPCIRFQRRILPSLILLLSRRVLLCSGPILASISPQFAWMRSRHPLSRYAPHFIMWRPLLGPGRYGVYFKCGLCGVVAFGDPHPPNPYLTKSFFHRPSLSLELKLASASSGRS